MTAKRLPIGKSEEGAEPIELSSDHSLTLNKTTNVLTNISAKPVSEILAIVPIEILQLMKYIDSSIKDNLEFGLYLCGTLDGTVLRVSKSYMVPKQVVSAASIKFKEDGAGEFNGVIHRHPNNCTGFSGEDKESINANHLFSLLYVNDIIKTGVVNIPLSGERGAPRIQLELEIYIDSPDMEFDRTEFKKIKRAKTVTIIPSQYPGSYPNYGKGFQFGQPVIPSTQQSPREPIGYGVGYTPVVAEGNVVDDDEDTWEDEMLGLREFIPGDEDENDTIDIDSRGGIIP